MCIRDRGKADSLALDANLLKTYQGSDYVVYTSNPYIYFLNINNDEELLTEREEAGVNKTILTYADFRKGISLAMNRMEFVAQQGHGKALYGYISDYMSMTSKTAPATATAKLPSRL